MRTLIKKSFSSPEEATEFPGARVEAVTIGGVQVRRLICEPGWVWSKSVGEEMDLATCALDHAVWIVTSGRFAVRMEDGSTEEFGPGDVGVIPPGHDAWVVGEEAVVGVDILAESLGKRASCKGSRRPQRRDGAGYRAST